MRWWAIYYFLFSLLLLMAENIYLCQLGCDASYKSQGPLNIHYRSCPKRLLPVVPHIDADFLDRVRALQDAQPETSDVEMLAPESPKLGNDDDRAVPLVSHVHNKYLACADIISVTTTNSDSRCFAFGEARTRVLSPLWPPPLCTKASLRRYCHDIFVSCHPCCSAFKR
jgi:hypothetical protein